MSRKKQWIVEFDVTGSYGKEKPEFDVMFILGSEAIFKSFEETLPTGKGSPTAWSNVRRAYKLGPIAEKALRILNKYWDSE